MSVLIKGMEMPEKGSWVTLRVFHDGQCFLYSWCGNDFDFMEHLTAVPVPPHGRLIDADALINEFKILQSGREIFGMELDSSFLSSGQELSTEWYCVEDAIEDAPTIIEAEEW